MIKVAKRFKIVILIPTLCLLVGCGTLYDRTAAFYKAEATSGQFVIDYKACHESALSKGIMKTGVPFTTFVWYEWWEGDRANTWMKFNADTDQVYKYGKKGQIFLAEYEMSLDQCMNKKGWMRKEFKQGNKGVYLLYKPPIY